MSSLPRRTWSFVAALCCVLATACAAVAAPASQPGAAPPPAAHKSPGSQPERMVEPNDPWTVEILADELLRCHKPDEYAALAGRTQKVIVAILAFGEADELKTLNSLTAIDRACVYTPLADSLTGDAKFGQWLLKNWPLARRLFRAMGDRDAGDYDVPVALRNLRELYEADATSVEAYPDLAVAFCIASANTENSRPATDNASRVDSFRYYTRSNVPFRYDLKRLPYELALYLADTRLPVDQRVWAANRYGRAGVPAESYRDVPYDDVALGQGKPKRIDSKRYTLPNILQAGGICVDQAYFATEVCKALGIPATVSSGTGRTGMGHAWVAYLRTTPQSPNAFWDSSIGRYEEDKFTRGKVRESATGQNITDVELMLTGLAAQLDLKRREEADVAVSLARMISDNIGKPTTRPDQGELVRLAALYNERFKDKRPPIRLDERVVPNRAIDMALAEDLVAMSLDRNCAFRPAWDLVMHLFAKGQIPTEHLNRFFGTLIARTINVFPDYTFDLLARAIPMMDPGAAQARACEQAFGLFPKRHDLQGRLLIMAGDAWASPKAGKPDDALRCYQQAIWLDLTVPDNVLLGCDRAEHLLVGAGRGDLVVAMYRTLFIKTPTTVDIALAMRQGTLWYQLGMRYAAALEAAGRPRDAANVRMQINSGNAAGPVRGG